MRSAEVPGPTKPGFRRRSVAVILLALAVSAAYAQPAIAKKHHPRPDLAISGVTFTRYAFQGESAHAIQFCDRTTNIGDAATPHASRTEMTMSHDLARIPPNLTITRDVPRLARKPPRGSHRPGESTHRGCGRGRDTALNLKLGSYDVNVCTDSEWRRSSRTGCYRCSKCFFVLKRTWTGTANGETDLPPGSTASKETWQSASVVYSFANAARQTGTFNYKPSGGTVNYQVS